MANDDDDLPIPDDENLNDESEPGVSALSVAELLDIARGPHDSWHTKHEVLGELRDRKVSEWGDIVLTIIASPDELPDLRLRLLREALRGKPAFAYAAWWLMAHTEYGHFEYEEHIVEAVDLISGVKADDHSADAAGVLLVLANEDLPLDLRGAAAAELFDALGPAGMPLVESYLGKDLVPALEESGSEWGADQLLEVIAMEEANPVPLRVGAQLLTQEFMKIGPRDFGPKWPCLGGSASSNALRRSVRPLLLPAARVHRPR